MCYQSVLFLLQLIDAYARDRAEYQQSRHSKTDVCAVSRLRRCFGSIYFNGARILGSFRLCIAVQIKGRYICDLLLFFAYGHAHDVQISLGFACSGRSVAEITVFIAGAKNTYARNIGQPHRLIGGKK